MMKKFLASVAAAGLVFAPIAAQANTRAMEAGVMIDRAPTAVSSSELLANDDDDDTGIYLLLTLLLIGAGIAFIIAGDASEGNDASPGTGG
ncbi:hypothetical protein [Erythrobacter alti]|uniref:hypothetical protein n=1 Tax=Erythrobacter alti TaxID=1896145 RepID=UPI0030F49BA4